MDGEGIQGLTASLLEAGARSVAATSWRVVLLLRTPRSSRLWLAGAGAGIEIVAAAARRRRASAAG
ncbi:MAG: hypothetical protein ACREOQ_08520 [Gemmatimonadales bacterium]